MDIRIIGETGEVLHVHGKGQGREGIWLAEGQVQGLYDAPVKSEWTRAEREVGGRLAGLSRTYRDLILGFHITAERLKYEEYIDVDSRLRDCFSYELDQYDEEARLARIEVESRGEVRWVDVQMFEQPDFDPDFDPEVDDYGNVIYSLRAGNPNWQSGTYVSEFTATEDGVGTIKAWNPTDLPCMQTWILTPAQKWTIPDVSWVGPKRNRRPGGEFGDRMIPLLPVTAAHGGLRINLDPMRLMLEDKNGTNVLGQVGGGFFFMHEIPPYTSTPVELPIKVEGVPPEGARAELVQVHQWSRPGGLW